MSDWMHDNDRRAEHMRQHTARKCDECREAGEWTGCDDEDCALAFDSIHVTDELRRALERVESLEKSFGVMVAIDESRKKKMWELDARVTGLTQERYRHTYLMTHEERGECGCDLCAAIMCPHGEPLHWHGDGCPACVQEEWAEAAPASDEFYKDLAERQNKILGMAENVFGVANMEEVGEMASCWDGVEDLGEFESGTKAGTKPCTKRLN